LSYTRMEITPHFREMLKYDTTSVIFCQDIFTDFSLLQRKGLRDILYSVSRIVHLRY